MRQTTITLAAALLFPVAASAIPFDFTGVPANTLLPTSVTDTSGVVADGFVFNGVNWVPAPLWRRNDSPNDLGLGVCSEGAASCATAGGDVNELDNATNPEAIRLTLPVNASWTELWVSSLDTGGSNNNESGILYWGSSNSPASLISTGGQFKFSHDSLSLGADAASSQLPLPVTFAASAPYLLFVNDPANSTNNDYLVWKGSIEVTSFDQPIPEPASVALLGSGLAALAFLRRRKAI